MGKNHTITRQLSLKLSKKFHKSIYKNGKGKAAAGLVMMAFVVLGSGVANQQVMAPRIDPAVYAPLLDTIAKGESKGNYNAHFGNAANTEIRFTDMTVAEVMRWQDDFVSQGQPSNAVGKYQIISPTMQTLVHDLGIDTNEQFDEKMQDRMAVALLERRGAMDYAEKKLSREQFAANLAQEWAALPKVIGDNPEQSYYANDGLNKVQVSIEEIYTALATIKH